MWVWRGGGSSLKHRGLAGGVSEEERNCFTTVESRFVVGTCPFAPPHLSSRMSESSAEPRLQPRLSPPGHTECQEVLFQTRLSSKRRNTRKKTNLWSSASRHGWGGRVKARKAHSSSLWCRALCCEIYLWLEGARPCQQGDLSGHHRASSNL